MKKNKLNSSEISDQMKAMYGRKKHPERVKMSFSLGYLAATIWCAYLLNGCAGSTVKVGACYEGACVDVEVTKLPVAQKGGGK